MSHSKSVKQPKPMNILVLGRSNIGKSLFITRFEEFLTERPSKNLFGLRWYSERWGAERLLIHKHSVLGEELHFIDTRGLCTVESINNMITLITKMTSDFTYRKYIDTINVILVLVDEDLGISRNYLKFYLGNCFLNFPESNIIFISLCEKADAFDGRSFMRTLQKFLQEMGSTIRVNLDKNIFILQKDTIFIDTRFHVNFAYNEEITNKGKLFYQKLYSHMQNLDRNSEQFHLTLKSVLEIITHIFNGLIEVLFSMEKRLQIDQTTGGYLGQRFIYCKKCSIEKGLLIRCHVPCDCINLQNKEAVGCSKFALITKACTACHCPILEHNYSIFYDSKRDNWKNTEKCYFEKSTIIILIATFFIFTEQNCNELPKYYYDFKNKCYWSTTKLNYITKDDAVLKEVDEKIKQLQVESYKPTLKEMMMCIKEITNNEFYCNIYDYNSSFINYFQNVLHCTISTSSSGDVGIDKIRNLAEATALKTEMRKAKYFGNDVKPIKLPEMKSTPRSPIMGESMEIKFLKSEIVTLKSRVSLLEQRLANSK